MMWVLCIAWSVTTFHLNNLFFHYAGDFSLIWGVFGYMVDQHCIKNWVIAFIATI